MRLAKTVSFIKFTIGIVAIEYVGIGLYVAVFLAG